MASNRIETLIAKGAWKSAQRAIEKQLDKGPDDHWLWARLSAVKYEQRDYAGALDAAKTALKIVADCPLALWSYAGALDMLDRPKEAAKVYTQMIGRGIEELRNPDADAEECWEGADWTRGLVMDSLFRLAGCLAKLGEQEKAVQWYTHFLDLLDFGIQGIYSRADAVARLRKIMNGKKTLPGVMERMKELKAVVG